MLPASTSWNFEAIGTKWQISLYDNIGNDVLRKLKTSIDHRIEAFDKVYSRFRPDSLISKISKKSGIHIFPEDANILFKFYKVLYELSDGAITPLIGQALKDAGSDANYTLKSKYIATTPEWDTVMKLKSITLETVLPVLLDFGAAGKGYLVDIVSDLIDTYGVRQYCVDAGGDIRVVNVDDALAIGLENPKDTEEVIGVVSISNGAICGSSGNRRTWEGYNHILNPHTRKSPDNILATWCMSSQTMIADGLATALYFIPAQKLMKQFTFEYCIVYANGEVECSNQFKDALFTASVIGQN